MDVCLACILSATARQSHNDNPAEAPLQWGSQLLCGSVAQWLTTKSTLCRRLQQLTDIHPALTLTVLQFFIMFHVSLVSDIPMLCFDDNHVIMST